MSHETYVWYIGRNKWWWQCLEVTCPANAARGPYKLRREADEATSDHADEVRGANA